MNFHVLHHVRSRFAGWLALRVGLAALAVAGGLTLALALSDAALELPEQLRATVPWLLGIAFIAALGVGFLEWRRLSESRLARLFEQSDAALGNRLINAVQLAEKSGASGTEEFFRRQDVSTGGWATASRRYSLEEANSEVVRDTCLFIAILRFVEAGF